MERTDVMDEALALLAPLGPDLENGMTSHAPMAAEALCALGRGDAVLPWLERYRAGMLPRPPRRARIRREEWRAALAQAERTQDWTEFFAEELRQAPWRDVLRLWVGRLGPGLCAAAAHGVIRVGHAVRSLETVESPARLLELADALGYWAATYQELPASAAAATTRLPAREAIARVAIVPPERRRFSGSIVSALVGLDEVAEFAPVIGLLDIARDPATTAVDLAGVFARVYLANARDFLTAIVFVHGVTGAVAAARLLPYVDEETAADVVRYAWQTGCGLYATFGSAAPAADEVEPPRESAATLADMAVAHGDDHAIKMTEACLSLYARSPDPAYLAAARDVLERLPRA